MTQQPQSFDELREAALAGRLNRRAVLRRALALSLSGPAIATLLAACGGDDDDDGGDETATEESGGDDTPTEAEATETEAEATETEEAEGTGTEAGATGTEAEGTGTEAGATGTESGSGSASGEWISSDVDPLTMGKEIEEPAAQGGVMIEGDSSDISTLNPLLRTDVPSGKVISMIFESLFVANPDTLEPVGLLAKEWQTSEDGLTWTIRLREDVTWQDGEPFTANDVKITYDLHMNPETASPRTGDLTGKVESVEVIDDMTIEFKTKFVNADFPLDIANYNIIAEHIWKDVAPADIASDPGSSGSDPSRVVGTGPFKFQEWIVEDRTVLVPNESFRGGAPVLDQWIYRYVGDATAVLQALKVGDIDWGDVPEASVGELDSTNVTVYDYPTLGFTFYGTNLDPEKTTLFQDVNVRKALLFALDRQAMIETIRFGYGEVAVGTMPVLSWAYNPDGIEETYPYDPEKAKQLLDEAGWAVGDDGVRAKEGQRLAFTMYTNAGDEVREQYLTTFQEFWREIGVEMTPQLEPFPAMLERITQTFDFEVFLVGFSWGATPGQESMWACDSYPSGFNLVKYCNPELDKVMQEALSTLDRDKRIELYTQMQNMVLEDLPMAVLDFPQGIIGLNSRVHNAFINAVNVRFNAHTWWVEQ